jgi:UDP-GlcNAc:undecaprenyl-phosphate GlcNAc-1-phosphate transferase
MELISSLFVSLIITIILATLFNRLAMKLGIYDVPNARKVHTVPVPRIGGLAIAAGTFVSIVLWAPLVYPLRAYLIGAAILVTFGIVDDWKGLNFKTKFAGQLAAALIVVFYGGIEIVKLGALLPEGTVLAKGVVVVLTLITIVGITNAINLADGLDGLAGGITMLSFACISYLAYIEQNFMVAIPAAALVGALFGFLRFNTFPATLFMGDTGSQFLGFSAAFFSLALTQGNTALSPLLPLIILGFPVLDTLTVMCERLAKGRSPFKADKNHFHHRLMRMGFFHTESVFIIYVIQSILIVLAYLLRFQSEWFLLVGYLAFAILVLAVFHWTDATGWKLQRFDFIDRVVKGHLRSLREQGLFIKTTFRIVEWGLPLLLILTCFLPSAIPSYFSVFSAVLFSGLILTWFFRKSWFKLALILSLYLFIPVLVYLGDTETGASINDILMRLYHLSYIFLMFFALLTLRLTKRMKGFRTTPMDFLILVFIFVFLALPDLRTQYGMMAVKIIIFYFCYEIVMGEVRDNKVGFAESLSAGAYIIVAIRGMIG